MLHPLCSYEHYPLLRTRDVGARSLIGDGNVDSKVRDAGQVIGSNQREQRPFKGDWPLCRILRDLNDISDVCNDV